MGELEQRYAHIAEQAEHILTLLDKDMTPWYKRWWSKLRSRS